MNGDIATGLTVVVFAVIVKLLPLLSMNVGDWLVSNTVLVTAVNGVVLGVNVVVYSGIPFTTRRLEI